MPTTQPPYLHQRPAPVLAVELRSHRFDRFSYIQGYNLLAGLLLPAFALAGHSFLLLLVGLSFGATWLLGLYTPDAQQYRFYLASGFMWVALSLIAALYLLH